MRTPLALTLTAAAALAVAAAPSAAADEHGAPVIPPHPHVLVLGAELDSSGRVLLGYRKCVDIASNRALPLNSQHEHIHFGRAGIALHDAGHAFIPVAPAFNLPWKDCASLIKFFGL